MSRKITLLILIASLFLFLCAPAFSETAGSGTENQVKSEGTGAPYIFYLLAVAASSYYFYRKRKDRDNAGHQTGSKDITPQLPADDGANNEAGHQKNHVETFDHDDKNKDQA